MYKMFFTLIPLKSNGNFYVYTKDKLVMGHQRCKMIKYCFYFNSFEVEREYILNNL